MSELLSVGLDVGTTSTQMVVSRLEVENRASHFAVPEMEISRREILYQSPVHFTPLLDEHRMDGPALRELVLDEYAKAGITRQTVDTGAIIITGETSRKENARTVLNALSDLAGDFVAAAAGPDLESVLAAKGAGATQYSKETGKTVLHMDIGGGTSNLALIRRGKIQATGCLNVGGRLIKYHPSGQVYYVSPVLEQLWNGKPGQAIDPSQAEDLCRTLAQVLEAAAGMGSSPYLSLLTTPGTAPLPLNAPDEEIVLSFSGGVADCIREELPWNVFGDLGPMLGQAIRKSRLCAGRFVLGTQTIRATVIGAGCHSAALSGSTVYRQNVTLPIKNIPVVPVQQDAALESLLRDVFSKQEGPSAVALPGLASPTYQQVAALADRIAAGARGHPLLLCLQEDMAKALGQALAARLGRDAEILCLDRVKFGEGSFLDVGNPVGPAYPVVIKTLILNQ